jgi:hypothetical protein
VFPPSRFTATYFTTLVYAERPEEFPRRPSVWMALEDAESLARAGENWRLDIGGNGA